jgi:hypothetical protein
MRAMSRFTPLLLGAVLVLCFALSTAGQTVAAEPSPFAGTAVPGYTRAMPVSLATAPTVTSASEGMLLTFPANAATSRQIFILRGNAGSNNGAGSSNSGSGGSHNGPGHYNGWGHENNSGGNIPGLITVPSFAGAFAAEGGPSQGNIYPYIMLGNNPAQGGRTEIPAEITAVSLQLLNVPSGFSANVPYSFEDLTEDSPNFSNSNYTSGNHTQFADAVQRAEFFNSMGPDWHTTLDYNVVNRVTIQIPRHVLVQLPNGNIVTVQSYYVGKAPDGTEFVEVLDLLFNFLFFNQAVNDINGNNYQTGGFNMQLWPNTYLFSIDSNGNPAGCCVLGFHTYIYDPSQEPVPIWLFAFASWISPGLFGAGFQDVTALSHEISEAYNDPFVNNQVPEWQFPGVPANSTACQGNLETADPIEVLANATFPITLREGQEVFAYHPQNEALLQWFEMGQTSNALNGAFSYPDTTVLPQSALPCPQ